MTVVSGLARRKTRLLKAVRRRWFEKRVPGTEIGEAVRIYDLICPLRYDILIRAEFIRFLANNPAYSPRHSDLATEPTEVRAYRAWFKEVNVRRFNPDIYDDEARLNDRFAKRVDRVRRLWDSMESRVFDPANPITLRSGKVIRPVNGKRIRTTFFAGDGCHRIACLLLKGQSVLGPEMFQLRVSRKLTPLDNSALLIGKTPIAESDYMAFLSKGYCDDQVLSSKEEIVRYVRENKPEALDELNSVLRYDLDRIRRSDPDLKNI